MFALRAGRFGAVVVAVVVLVGGVLAGTVPAVASTPGAKTSPWSSSAAPLPANAAAEPLVLFDSQSCPASGSCVAVGTYVDTSGHEQGLIDTLSGGAWTSMEAPLPANADAAGAVLSDVTCSRRRLLSGRGGIQH